MVSEPPGSPGATRKSRATRARLLLAAREVFSREGFDSASTRSIAAAADANPALIFRYFGSKAGLYEAAILQPLQGFIEGFVNDWATYQEQPHPHTQTASEWLGGLYDLFCEHQGLLLGLVRPGKRVGEMEGEAAQIAEWITTALDKVGVVIETEAERRGWSGFDTSMSIRCAVGIALSFSVLRDWIFPASGAGPTRDEIVSGMVSFVLRSMSNPDGVYGDAGTQSL